MKICSYVHNFICNVPQKQPTIHTSRESYDSPNNFRRQKVNNFMYIFNHFGCEMFCPFKNSFRMFTVAMMFIWLSKYLLYNTGDNKSSDSPRKTRKKITKICSGAIVWMASPCLESGPGIFAGNFEFLYCIH